MCRPMEDTLQASPMSTDMRGPSDRPSPIRTMVAMSMKTTSVHTPRLPKGVPTTCGVVDDEELRKL